MSSQIYIDLENLENKSVEVYYGINKVVTEPEIRIGKFTKDF